MDPTLSAELVALKADKESTTADLVTPHTHTHTPHTHARTTLPSLRSVDLSVSVRMRGE